MMLLWKIRYLDRSDKQFKDRYLYLNTKSLDPVTRATVELVAESKSHCIAPVETGICLRES